VPAEIAGHIADAAAFRRYGSEVVRRFIGGSVPAFEVDLTNWGSYAPLLG
jgi:hypothetical protein